MDPTLTPQRREAERSLTIAIKLLAARDLIGSKRFADLALDADPSLSDDRADQILAVADVLLASQKRINNHPDWYSILQLPHPNPNPNPDPADANLPKLHFRRLSLLLHPDRNRLPGADTAFNLISDAYSVLSDPSKKSVFDSELCIADDLAGGSGSYRNANHSNSNNQPPPAFWTLCPSCCSVHQYARMYLNKMLLCQNCRKSFHAVELQTKPSVVPGTDMYYATWGFFPLGFANPNGTDWTPFVETGNAGGGSRSGLHQDQPSGFGGGSGGNGGGGGGGNGGIGSSSLPRGPYKKKAARKKVMGRPRGRPSGSIAAAAAAAAVELKNGGDGSSDGRVQGEEEARGININEAAKGLGEEDIDMIMDLASTEDMLGNLQNLPFLKDGAINIRFQ